MREDDISRHAAHLKIRYSRLQESFSRLDNVPLNVFEDLSKEIYKVEEKRNKRLVVLAFISYVIAGLLMPFVIFKLMALTQSYTPVILDLFKKIHEVYEDNIFLWFSFYFLCFMVFSAAVHLFVSDGKLKVQLETSSKKLEVDFFEASKNNAAYLIVFLFLVYVLLLAPLIYVYSMQILSENYVKNIFYAWMIVPCGILSLIPMLFIFSVIVIIDHFLTARLGKLISDHPINLVSELMEFLEIFKALNQSNFSIDMKVSAGNKIEKIGNIIRNTKFLCGVNKYGYQKVFDEFEKFSLTFLSLNSCIFLSTPQNNNHLIRVVTSTLNSVVKGDFGSLNKHLSTDIKQVVVRGNYFYLRKFITIVLLVSWLVIPIILWIMSLHVFEIRTDDISKTLITVLYSAWALIGLLTLFPSLAPEIRSAIVEVTKNRFSQ